MQRLPVDVAVPGERMRSAARTADILPGQPLGRITHTILVRFEVGIVVALQVDPRVSLRSERHLHLTVDRAAPVAPDPRLAVEATVADVEAAALGVGDL